ncbi:MAG: ECF transporter S component [Peptoanaerobacter stomatis]|uniref:ECF transporter S component n=1 Tax=Peptoanaerobacter stomatis TaxID=796937 RepID=UPI003FA08398
MTNSKSIKSLVIYGLCIALVCVITMVVQIPVPMTQGYVHLGDSCILLIAIFFGKKYGAAAGGLGSALADILSGYAHWALFTLIIKALMGFVAGSLSNYRYSKSKFMSVNTTIASLLTIAVMVIGYLIGGTILKGSFAVALTSVPSNAIQGVMGMVLFFAIGKAFDKVHLNNYIHKFQN